MKENEARMLRMLQGAVYGEAIGDALGVPYEGLARDAFSCITMIDGVRPAGTYSDDTAMTLATLDSLMHCDGQVDVEDLRRRYLDWLEDGKYTADGTVFGVGRTTAEALRGGVGLSGERDNGNGSLMRSIPLAFFDVDDDAIRQASAVTHAHPTSMDACVRFVHAARALLGGADTRQAARTGGHDRIWEQPRDAIRSTGYVLDTLPAALWCLTTTDSYVDCVLTAVNLGGDADTTAAVAGALAGIVYGFDDEREDGRGIPGKWDDMLRGWRVIANVISGGPLDVEDWNIAQSMDEEAGLGTVDRDVSPCEQGDELVMRAMLCGDDEERVLLFGHAARCFAAGVELGDAQCATNLGVLYLYGHVHAKDPAAAARACFERGAQMGSAECGCYMGDLYRDGKGVEQNVDEAFSWYEEAYRLIPSSLDRNDPHDCVIVSMINLRLGQGYEWLLSDSDGCPAGLREDIHARARMHYEHARDSACRAVEGGLRMNLKELVLSKAGLERLEDL
ncbi:ADP-ribosylglycohydrolase family protein [Bifidobacterium cuniculi]|uniref:ADP-ribosylglycohydrolase n=1 Tax=Bifidobacterium cuniculi TaxID=1688 RepID=A0A087AHT0_9BIFI|nr:ADP-ribosylglycohydrolase family protein [Bifidobacterium cuniculi]KFI58330.1 ADP-ribosylglycohydrolase [Bifidobacterium cuniculi]